MRWIMYLRMKIQFCVNLFSEKEIKDALFQMEKNKAIGLGKIPIEFYQVCWKIVKNNIIQLFDDFHKEKVDICRINYGIITLLPKVSDAAKIQQFRPICLLNVIYKIITKVLTLRLNKMANKVISESQTAFIPGRFILDGVLIIHEVLHELRMKKKQELC